MQKQTHKGEQEVDVHFRIHAKNNNTQLYTIQRSIEISATDKEPMHN